MRTTFALLGLSTIATIAFFGCSTGDSAVATDRTPAKTDGDRAVEQVTFELRTTAELPSCRGLPGATAFVASPPSMWRCDGRSWMELLCSVGASGAVAFSSLDRDLFACVAGRWTEIGPMGDPCPPGVRALVRVTPEQPGANCAQGGQRVDIGHDLDADGVLAASEIVQTTYVCKEPVATSCGLGQSLCGTTCVDLSTSALHCGACDRSCGADVCSAGTCQTSLTLARGGDKWGLALDGSYAYFTSIASNRLVRVPKAGGTPAELAVGVAPMGVALAGGRLYVANSGSNTVSVVDLSTFTVLATIPVGLNPRYVAAGGGVVYVPSFTTTYMPPTSVTTISLINAATNAVTTTWTSAGYPVYGIAADADRAYWVTHYSNWVFSRAPGDPSEQFTFFTSFPPSGVAPGNNGSLYISITADPATASGRITRFVWPPAVGGETPIVLGQRDPRGITVDGDWVYWVNTGDEIASVRKVRRIGGAVTTLASAWSAKALAVDATHAYFTDSEGLKRVAK